MILTESNNKITGSARSVNGFDLYEAIYQCGDLLEKFGGHKYAAGLTMDINNLVAFQERFEEVVASRITPEMLTPTIEIDTNIVLDAITPKQPRPPKNWGSGRGGRPWRRLKEKIHLRDNWTCQHCRRVTTQLELDHIVHVAQGGTDEESNLQSLCPPCHKDKTLKESRQ